VWRLANKNGSTNCNLRIGDRILVNTKNGRSCITVTRIEELDERPIEKTIKKCYSKR
jgi:uncharacterized membrane protein YjjP (DUF1212 family)